MTDKKPPSIARPRKRYSPDKIVHATADDGRRIVGQQSFRDALVAGLIIVIVFSVLWAMLSTLTNRIFPWMTIILGILVGLVIRRAGRGIDWRFPTLAAVIAVAGSLASNIVVTAAFTARALETTTLAILRAVTTMTWPVFFSEFLNAADFVYEFVAAGVAAFYANRRLNRAEFLAVKKYEEEIASLRSP